MALPYSDVDPTLTLTTTPIFTFHNAIESYLTFILNLTVTLILT